MTVYFVSRHVGAQFWARYHDRIGALPLSIDRYVEHFDPSVTQAGDVVIGTLPLAAIARVQERGGQFVSLDIATPPQRRGKELSATEMVSLGAVLTPYRVEALEPRTVAAKMPAPAANPQRSVTLMLVSDQLPPQLIGLDLHATTEVWLVATPAMEHKARLLQRILKRWNAPQGKPPASRVRAIEGGAFHALRGAAQGLIDEAVRAGFGQILLNATGGTKPMMMAFVQAATDAARQGLPVQVCYVDTAAQTADSLTEAPPQSLRRVLNIEQLVACSGRDLDGAAHPAPEFQAQMQRSELHRHLLALAEREVGLLNGCAAGLADLPPQERAQGRLRVNADLAKVLRRSHVPGLPPLGEHLHQCGVLRSPPALDDAGGTLELRAPAEAGYLKGGWLEACVAACLAQSGADEWGAGVQVLGDRKNELDGVLVAGNRLLVLEVKTENQHREKGGGKKNNAAEAAFYKLDSLGGALAPLFSGRWYVSARPLDQADLERADALRIRVFAPGAGDWGSPISELPAALRAWVRRSQGAMPVSPRLRPSVVDIDLRKWGPRETKPYGAGKQGSGGSSIKPAQAAALQKLKRQKAGAGAPPAP